MFAAGLALLVVGVVLGLLLPPFGFAVAIAGLVVLVLAARAGRKEGHAARGRR
jgi:hypothetical protein